MVRIRFFAILTVILGLGATVPWLGGIAQQLRHEGDNPSTWTMALFTLNLFGLLVPVLGLGALLTSVAVVEVYGRYWLRHNWFGRFAHWCLGYPQTSYCAYSAGLTFWVLGFAMVPLVLIALPIYLYYLSQTNPEEYLMLFRLTLVALGVGVFNFINLRVGRRWPKVSGSVNLIIILAGIAFGLWMFGFGILLPAFILGTAAILGGYLLRTTGLAEKICVPPGNYAHNNSAHD